MTLRLDTWKGIEVAPSSHDITIIKAVSPESELPAGPNLIATLEMSDKTADAWSVKFSPDGKRIFTNGYPSGVVQFWDVATGQEVRRIATKPGSRGWADYAARSSDWKTMYFAEHETTIRRVMNAGQPVNRFDFTGRIRVWDIESGQEKPSLAALPNTGHNHVEISPNDRYLVSVENRSHIADDQATSRQTMVTDLKSGERWKLADGIAPWIFSRDGNRVFVSVEGAGAVLPSVYSYDLTTRSRVAEVFPADRENDYLVRTVANCDKLLAVLQAGGKSAVREYVLLDSATLQERGRFALSSDPKVRGRGFGRFTPDSRRLVATDSGSNLYVWNVADAKLEKTIVHPSPRRSHSLDVSPDGRYAAIGWSSPLDPQTDNRGEPELADMPRPRITVVDLTGQTPNREFVTPAGFGVRVCFSPDGKKLAAGGTGAVYLFDLTASK